MPKAKKAVEKEGKVLLLTVFAVRVNVPVKTAPYFNYVPRKFSPAENSNPATTINRHYRQGYLADNKTKVIVFRHFYNVPEDRFGKTMVATVEIFQKTVPDKRKEGNFINFIYEDITFQPDTSATTEHKFRDDPENKCGGTPIPRTNKVIYFKPVEVYKPKAVAVG